MRAKPSRLRKSEGFTSGNAAGEAWRRHSRRIAIGASLSLILMGGVLIFTTAAVPQTEPVAPVEQAVAITPDPPGTIDGAKNPELIPDEVALRMIVLAVAEPVDATEQMRERARAKLNPIGLSEDDTAAFLGLLAEYQIQVDALDKQVADIYVRAPFPNAASTDYKQLLELGNQKDQLTNNAVSAIPAKLSQDGFTKLLAFLPQAKKGIKVTP